eukprot:scaffold38294_cov260-Amphora_coffeaeformis.AAC.2
MSLQPPPDKTDEGRYKTVSPITTTTTANLGSQVTLSSANRPTGSDILGITTSTSTGVVEHLVLQHCPIHKASMDAFRQAIPGPLQSLTIRQCCWADIETTIPALAAWIADETEIQSITLHSNSFKMSQYQPPQREWPAVHLNRLVTAIQPTTRVSLGPEFFTGTAGEQAMRVVCEACTSLHLCGDGLDPRGNNNDDNDSNAIHLQGLYQERFQFYDLGERRTGLSHVTTFGSLMRGLTARFVRNLGPFATRRYTSRYVGFASMYIFGLSFGTAGRTNGEGFDAPYNITSLAFSSHSLDGYLGDSTIYSTPIQYHVT